MIPRKSHQSYHPCLVVVIVIDQSAHSARHFREACLDNERAGTPADQQHLANERGSTVGMAALQIVCSGEE